MLAAVEDDLEVIATSGVDGYARLADRLSRASRIGAFAVLAEIFVAAWYLRTGYTVLSVNPDNHQGDVVVADGEGSAHIEVMNLIGSHQAWSWVDAWGELYTQLRLLDLPCFVSFSSGPAIDYCRSAEAPYPVRTSLPVPTLNDITAICEIVLMKQYAPRHPVPDNPQLASRIRLEAFSKKWPEAWIELVDPTPELAAGSVMGSWGGVGTLHPNALRDRILSKKAPQGSGHKILVVETSHYAGSTFADGADIPVIRSEIAKMVKSWGAIITFDRRWTEPTAAGGWVLFCRDDVRQLVPPHPNLG
jgi:hypothetical protein